jgi:hypothetical protein
MMPKRCFGSTALAQRLSMIYGKPRPRQNGNTVRKLKDNRE